MIHRRGEPYPRGGTRTHGLKLAANRCKGCAENAGECGSFWPSEWNWGRDSNPRLDHLVERSLATFDERTREAIAREAMRIAVEDHAVILLHHQLASWAMRARLRYAGRTDESTLAQGFK